MEQKCCQPVVMYETSINMWQFSISTGSPDFFCQQYYSPENQRMSTENQWLVRMYSLLKQFLSTSRVGFIHAQFIPFLGIGFKHFPGGDRRNSINRRTVVSTMLDVPASHVSREKTLLLTVEYVTMLNPGCLIGILLTVYVQNPHITGQDFIPYIP